jgi:hypothetical protein
MFVAVFLYSKGYALMRVDPQESEDVRGAQQLYADLGYFKKYDDIPV